MRKIIPLGGEVSTTGKLRSTIACWVLRTPNSASWLVPPNTSSVPDATADELQQIRSGAVVERVVQTDWTNGTGLPAVAELSNLAVARYNEIQQDVANESALAEAIGGFSYDGSVWSLTSQKPVPEQAREPGRSATGPIRQQPGGSNSEPLERIAQILSDIRSLILEKT